MEEKMDQDDYTISINQATISSTIGDLSCTSLIDYSTDILDISNFDSTITISTTDYDEYNIKRKDIRNNGKIPIDIWARMYNNGNIDD
jgi:hypothetical protein